MTANKLLTRERCRACRGKGWRWVRASRADALRRIDGTTVDLAQVDCFECSGVGGKRAA
ncbi:hypothetical protein [Nonomuraea sp. NPDC048826]|uniref:hypothetical protein n=1 Tax=Nonomuraea sp. NPDC048826 TaxID=3364347 RepID=UPI003716D28B